MFISRHSLTICLPFRRQYLTFICKEIQHDLGRACDCLPFRKQTVIIKLTEELFCTEAVIKKTCKCRSCRCREKRTFLRTTVACWADKVPCHSTVEKRAVHDQGRFEMKVIIISLYILMVKAIEGIEWGMR